MKTTHPTKNSVSHLGDPSYEDISRRAYELWIQEGCPSGREVFHWHEAERQIRALNTKQNPGRVQKSPPAPAGNRPIASRMDDSSPFNAFEEEAPLSAKLERRLADTNVKPPRSSISSADID
jgi:hypothetical protein